MKKIVLLISFLFLMLLCGYLTAALMESQQLELGTPMVDFTLPAADGNAYSLDSFSDAQALVVIITCNHCPYAKAAWPVLIDLQSQFKDKNVQFVGINPNDEQEYPEDSLEKMKEYKDKYSINFPYLRDESQQIAKALNAVCTPDIYVFDQERKLFYHGRINDNWQNPDKVTDHTLKNAINALLAGKQPPENQPPSMGCSIKWKN